MGFERNLWKPFFHPRFWTFCTYANRNCQKSIAAYLRPNRRKLFSPRVEQNPTICCCCAVEDLGVQTIISTKIEHHAVLHALDFLATKGCQVVYLPVNQQGEINYADLEAALAADDSKKLVTLMHVTTRLERYSTLNVPIFATYNALFHTDAVQGVGHFAIDLEEIKIDFLRQLLINFTVPKG